MGLRDRIHFAREGLKEQVMAEYVQTVENDIHEQKLGNTNQIGQFRLG